MRLRGALAGLVAEACLPSSAVLSVSVSLNFSRLTLAVLHPVPIITIGPLATTRPPPSLPHAGIFASGARCHSPVKRFGSSPIPTQETSQRPVAAGYTPGRLETTHAGSLAVVASALRVFQPLSPVRIHDACTGFLRRRRSQDWSVNHLWLAVAELLSAGFRPPRLPIADACCVVLIPLSKYSSSKSNLLRR